MFVLLQVYPGGSEASDHWNRAVQFSLGPPGEDGGHVERLDVRLQEFLDLPHKLAEFGKRHAYRK